MSGQAIGSVIGAAVGAYFGGPAGAQLGMAIGGFIGGAVDPTRINSPKIGDGQAQSATDGVPIAWVQGTATVAGTIVQFSPRRQVKVKDSGKGGPVVSHYEAHQDFAVLICESCVSRDSVMSNVVMVTQDGTVVYDVRPGSTMLSASAKWKRGVDFLYGDEGQLPHPTLEAITGVGNQVAYRGYLTAVFRDFNITKASNRIPSFTFTVSGSPAADIINQDFAVVATDATPHPNLPSNSLTVQMDLTDTLLLQIKTGLTYAAWNLYDSKSGHPWWCAVSVKNNDTGATSTVFTNYGSTPAEANAAGVAWGIASFTGASSWTVFCSDDIPGDNQGGMSVCVSQLNGGAVTASNLVDIVQRVALRGGLDSSDIDTSGLSGIPVAGYPIARQCGANDALNPLLAAFFAYASEYDGKLNFNLYGGDALITIDADDLLEGNQANGGNITSKLRNQETEFPKRIIASYIDPAQNYFACQVSASRLAVDVKSIGDVSMQIPVVMPANQATQAADKALKIAYATLEGTLSYSVPYAGSATYLTMCAGESIIYSGKRYVIDEAIISNGYLKLSTRYDRQSAYTSTIQAITGNVPIAPASPYSGATQLQVMNLPSLRPQDTYGVYLAASGIAGNTEWQGCNVMMSLDGQMTWNTVASMTGSIMGALTVAEPAGHEPLTVQMNGDLETITAAQLAANGNAFALTTAGVSELGQFQTATEQATADQYQLTGTLRGLKGTTEVLHNAGDAFTMLDNVSFVAIDASFARQTIYFKAPGFGEDAASAAVSSIVYKPDTTIIYNGGKTGT